MTRKQAADRQHRVEEAFAKRRARAQAAAATRKRLNAERQAAVAKMSKDGVFTKAMEEARAREAAKQASAGIPDGKDFRFNESTRHWEYVGKAGVPHTTAKVEWRDGVAPNTVEPAGETIKRLASQHQQALEENKQLRRDRDHHKHEAEKLTLRLDAVLYALVMMQHRIRALETRLGAGGGDYVALAVAGER